VDYSISLKLCTEFKGVEIQKCCKSARSRGQTSRSQRDITCAKIRKIINNSARDWMILFKFRSDFDHVTLDKPRNFKVEGLKVKVIA